MLATKLMTDQSEHPQEGCSEDSRVGAHQQRIKDDSDNSYDRTPPAPYKGAENKRKSQSNDGDIEATD